jgi:hypothetical protein
MCAVEEKLEGKGGVEFEDEGSRWNNGREEGRLLRVGGTAVGKQDGEGRESGPRLWEARECKEDTSSASHT